MRFPILPDSGPEADDHATLRYDAATKRWVPGPVVDPAEVAAMDGVLADFQAGMDATDAGVSALVDDGASATATSVARVMAAPMANSLAEGVQGRSLASTPMPDAVTLLTGKPDDPVKATAFINQTVTNVTSPTNPQATAWKIEGSGGTVLRLDKDLPNVDASHANAVTVWVYLPEPEKINYLYVALVGSSGSWVRQSNQPLSSTEGGLVRGWNLLRMPSYAANPGYTYLDDLTLVSVRGYYNAATSMIVGPLVVERRPKASVVIINDWGSKPFYDNAYPGCKASGYPVTFALRTGLLGTGVYPMNHISLAEAQTLAAENGNAMSFHSWDGEANSGYTPAQALDALSKAQAGLVTGGLWSEAAVHRAAWVQNNAPAAAARATDPFLATSATYSQKAQVTLWPPTRRHDIPRLVIHGRSSGDIDADFALLEATRTVGLFYTHGVVPAGDEGTVHCTQAQWDYFKAKVDAGVAAGWLEVVTVPQLVARERLSMPSEPPA